jgi:DNA-directed RNA polymerase specialized sigma24 family protein
MEVEMSSLPQCSAEQSRRDRVPALAHQLYRERYHYLLRIARRNGASDDASDAVNDAFSAFLDKFDPDGGAPPLAWVILTLKRRCWAIGRSRHLDRRVGQEADRNSGEPGFSIANIPAKMAGPEETIERTEYVLEARAKLAILKPQELRALSLLATGYTYLEIAAMNRWTYTKVNRCVSEGRARMRASAAPEQAQTHSLGAKPDPSTS